MSVECCECEHDLRCGHDKSCSRYIAPCKDCKKDPYCDEECYCECHTKKRKKTK